MKAGILKTVHETANDFFEAGLMQPLTMKDFDRLCLPHIEKLSPKSIQLLRVKEMVSQAVLARCLNVSASAVKKWETGEKSPSGAALKLLNIVRHKGLKWLL